MKSVNRYVDKGLPVCRYRGATESLQNNCVLQHFISTKTKRRRWRRRGRRRKNDLILIWVTLLSQTWIRTCGARCKSSGSILSHIMNEWMYVCTFSRFSELKIYYTWWNSSISKNTGFWTLFLLAVFCFWPAKRI